MIVEVSKTEPQHVLVYGVNVATHRVEIKERNGEWQEAELEEMEYGYKLLNPLQDNSQYTFRAKRLR